MTRMIYRVKILPRGRRGGCHSRRWGSSIEADPSLSWTRACGDLTNQRRVLRVLTNQRRVLGVLTNERRGLGVLTNERRVFTCPRHVLQTRIPVIEHVPALDTGVEVHRPPDVVDHLHLEQDEN